MLAQLCLTIGLTLAAPTARTAQPCGPSFSDVVVFGDSFSDNGNGSYAITNGSWPPPQYYKGRFSNGQVWVEHLAQNLSATLHDYAVGGATTSNALVQGYTGNGSTVPVPSVDEQADGFLRSLPPNLNMATTLFIVSGGANDLFFNPNLSAYQSKDVLRQTTEKLQGAGGKSFLYFNYYHTDLIPFDSFTTVENKAQNKKWSDDFERALSDLHNEVPGSFYYNLAEELMPHLYYYGEPTSYGFDQFGAYGSCLVGIYKETKRVTLCPDADKKVFWDEYHPTRVTHGLIASQVSALIHGS